MEPNQEPQPKLSETPANSARGEKILQPSQEFVKELQATQQAEPTQPTAPVENRAACYWANS